jgi:cobalt/nickel transport protein
MRYGIFLAAGLSVSLALAVLLSPWASSSPDGLERVAKDKGFLEKAEATEPLWQASPAPDYRVPGVPREGVSTALAGLLGTAITFGAAWLLGRAVARRRPTPASGTEGT